MLVLGGPLAATQLIDKFSSKLAFGGPHGFFPPGNPSSEVGCFTPHPHLMGFPEEGGRLDPKHTVLKTTSQTDRLLPVALLQNTSPDEFV